MVGHSLGGMFALWHAAAGSKRIVEVIAVGAPAVALPGVRVRMPLSPLTVRGLGVAILRAPTPPGVYRRMLVQGLGSAEVEAMPASLFEALWQSARQPENARSAASLMHAIDRFRRPRPESVLTAEELAAIRVPTHFILGSDDPYLSPQDARVSIARIPGATVHEMRAGHGPWLVDPRKVARLIAAQEPSVRSRRRTAARGQSHLARRPFPRRQVSAMDNHLRRATTDDIGAISRLHVQLYAHELPGMLRGKFEAQVELARRLVEPVPLGRRYVLEREGEVVGMGSLATHDEPRPETPPRVLHHAPSVMGPVNGVWSILVQQGDC